MAQKTRAQLKELFANFKFPTGGDFDDLIDSFLNLLDDTTLPSQGGLKRTVIDIGDWDMDADQTKIVSHSLDTSKVRNVNAVIRSDNGSVVTNLVCDPVNFSAASPAPAGNTVFGNSIGLNRADGSGYNSATYSTTSYNRGWVVIDYVE